MNMLYRLHYALDYILYIIYIYILHYMILYDISYLLQIDVLLIALCLPDIRAQIASRSKLEDPFTALLKSQW